MAVRTIAQLKAWFRKGLYPTESQFADWLDSYRHKDEKVAISEVTGLPGALNKKYDKSEGTELEENVKELAVKYSELGEELENQLAAIGYSKERFAEIKGIVERNAELAQDAYSRELIINLPRATDNDNPMESLASALEMVPEEYRRPGVIVRYFVSEEHAEGDPTNHWEAWTWDTTPFDDWEWDDLTHWRRCDAAYVEAKAESAEAKAAALEASKGKADGLAPLNAAGVIDGHYMPEALDVRSFVGIVDEAVAVEDGLAGSRGTVIYLSKQEGGAVFALYAGGQYYSRWLNCAAWGSQTAGGVKPVANKLYVDTQANRLYTWNDGKLTPTWGVSGSEDITIGDTGALSLTQRAKMAHFIDRWNEAWKIYGVQYGKYDPDNAPDAGHPFQGNGLWMTYEEAIPILELAPFSKLEFGDDSFKNRFRYMGQRGTYNPRTLVPFNLFSVNAPVGSADGMFNQWIDTNLEVLVFHENTPPNGVRVLFTSFKHTFSMCKNLHTIKGLSLRGVSNSNNTAGMFDYCAKLQNLTASFLHCDVSLKDSPLLTRESIVYLVQYASNTAPITVTVHPDVYAKLTGDTTNAAAAALSTEEAAQWQQVVTDAAAKNISFATV